MVELIVVICIILILAGIAIFGISSWINWVHFKEQNENARTLYSVAQNQIGEYSAHGQLESKVQEKIMTDTGYRNVIDFDVLKLIGADGNTIDTNTLWPASINKTNAAQYIGTVCYAMGTEADYKTYCDDPDKLDADGKSEIRMMYDMLVPYLYDPSILKASVCMEFTPDDGQIYSVFYSNIGKNSENYFKYQDDDTTRGQVSIHSRKADYREKRMVGYYGVGSLSAVLETAGGDKPVLENVMLRNEETLNLNFTLGGSDDAFNRMTYTIEVYDTDTGHKLMNVIFEGRDLGHSGTNAKKVIDCRVVRFDEAGNPWEHDIKTYSYDNWAFKCPFLVEQKSDNSIKIIMDAADITASDTWYIFNSQDLKDKLKETRYGYEEYNKYIKTYSFTRFGLDTDNIYCTVQGSGSLYPQTTTKQSNTSCVYFEDAYKDGTGNIYDIANGRHLYNMRYKEAENNGTVTYRLENDINWSDFVTKGLYYTNKLTSNTSDYNTRYSKIKEINTYANEPIDRDDIPFPAIRELREGNTFISKSITASIISDIHFNGYDSCYLMSDTSVYANGMGEVHYQCPVGLFVVNKGTIQNIVLDKVQVLGTDYVGTFCGKNIGDLIQLSVKNTVPDDESLKSKVEGNSYVGGITGKDITSEVSSGGERIERKYIELENYALVKGEQYIGGIIGDIEVNSGTDIWIKVTGSRNYGAIESTPGEIANGKYIGGIAGYISNNTNNTEAVKIENCTGSSRYTEEEIKEIFKNEDTLKAKLNGQYVGGIAGYNKGGMIYECNALNISNEESYLFGEKYVGGIVGYNEGIATTSGSVIALNGLNGVVDTNVIGKSLVGGVVGVNDGRLENWTNRGMIAATETYAGGIAGANAKAGWWVEKDAYYNDNKTGIIVDCTSEVYLDNAAKSIAENKFFRKADFIGGIAGYNGGDIITVESESKRVTAYVTGNNYVGGIIGFNDAGGDIEGYSLSGGYIKAEGSFVGGMIGLNASKEILETNGEEALANPMISSPNEVSGDFCVGGVIGGNIVPAGGNRWLEGINLYMSFKADNFLGNVKAKAFAGGYIGYNRILGEWESADSYIKDCIKIADADLLKDSKDNAELKKGYASIIEDFNNKNAEREKENESNVKLNIVGGKEGSMSDVRLESIESDIFAGGVIGYNSEATQIVISNIVNRTPVSTLVATENDTEHPKKKNIPYSYSGGIMSKVTKYAVVDNCENYSEGDTTTYDGRYLGGICEVNEGIIRNCSVPGIGNSNRSYVGGIAGLNEGTIESCDFDKESTVTGKDYVGGIAAENYGEIKNISLNGGTIRAYDNCAGGIVAANYGTVKFDTVKSGKIYINSSGKENRKEENYGIGGIAGINEAKWNEVIPAVTYTGSGEKFILSGNISGVKNIGGIIGDNRSETTLSSWNNKASVTAANGNAGGIAGLNGSKIEICENSGDISATASGNAGGIVAENNNSISSCVNSGTVTSANGNAGGIAAENDNLITNCNITGADSNLTVIEALNSAGGIAGVNNSEVKNCTVKYAKVQNTKNSGKNESSVGGLVGSNNKKLIEGGAVNYSKVRTYVSGDNINVGGAAGKNEAEIDNVKVTGNATSPDTAFDSATVGFADKNASHANMGGIAGYSIGSITGCLVTADITGNMGSSGTGYGGIVGIYAPLIPGTSVSDCSYSGNLRANGSSDNMVSIGGIAGNLSALGMIKSCYIGTDAATTITTGYQNTYPGYQNTYAAGYVGGIAGKSYGTITDSGIKTNIIAENLSDNHIELLNVTSDADNNVSINNYMGHTGGIVGELNSGASVNNCTTGKKWTITVHQYINLAGTGGIIGYSSSGMDIKKCTNFATVASTYNDYSDNVAVGGLIGRLENNSRNGMIIDNFVNYGEITGTVVGGAIGRLKYKGATFNKCINYATLRSTGSKSKTAGGILGSFMTNVESNDYAAFVSCQNHGNIETAQNAGGITGYISGESTITVTYSDCVNSGAIIMTKDDANTYGGITSATNDQKAYFYRCRNYGNVKVTLSDSKKSKYKNDYKTDDYTKIPDYINKGIVGKKTTSGLQVIRDCFTFGNPTGIANKPDSGKGEISRCYYYNCQNEKDKYATGTYLKFKYTDEKFNNLKTLRDSDNDKIIMSDFSFDLRNIVRNDFTSQYDPAIITPNKAENEGKHRQRLYLDVDPKILKYYETLSGTSNIKDIRIINSGGRLLVIWGHLDTRYDHDQLMYKVGDGTWQGPVSVGYGVQSYTIPITDIAGKDVKVAIRSVNSSYSNTDFGSSWLNNYGPDKNTTEQNAGVWGTYDLKAVKEEQKAPKVHIEMTPTDSNKDAFTAVLDNPEDYKDDRATTIEITGIPRLSSGKSTIEINTQKGYSEPFTFQSYDNVNVNVRARGNDNYAESTIVSYTAVTYDGIKLTKTDYVKTEFNDFYGNTIGGMSNQIIMDKQTGKDMDVLPTPTPKAGEIIWPEIKPDFYMDSELVVEDYVIDGDIALPVSVASGNSHVSSYGAEVTTVLNELPKDFMNYGGITARTYPWHGQVDFCWYGHPVVESVSLETILGYIKGKNLYDTKRYTNTAGQVSVFIDKDGKTALNDGYVLRLNKDGTYSVIYSSILHYRDTYSKQIDEKNYTVDHKNGAIISGSYSKKVYKEPVIEPEMVISDDGDQYTFCWDKKDTYTDEDKAAVYELQLIGHTTDENTGEAKEVLLETVTVDNKNVKEPYWTYTFIDKNGNWDYKNLTLYVERKGTVDTLGKTEVFPSCSERQFTVKVRFSRIARPSVSLQRDESGTIDKDELIYNIKWDAVPLDERKEVKAYELLIEPLNPDGTVNESKVIKKEIKPDTEEDNQVSTTFDFSGYEPGQRFNISIRALAKQTSEYYRDGIKGVVREMTLPSRQKTPDVSKLVIEPEYSTDTSMTLKEMNQGVLLALKNTDMSGIEGKYEIAVAIYDSEPSEQDKKDTSHVEGGWNTGAERTIISKESAAVMSGNSADSAYRLVSGIDSKDAGKWLKIVMRNVSDNNISSWWSDKDADGLTVNYSWLRIPRVRVEEPEVTQEQSVLYYDVETGDWSLKEKEEGSEAAVSQTAFAFEMPLYADSCRIQRIGFEKETEFSSEAVYTRQDADWIYLEETEDSEDAYNVFMASTREGFNEEMKEIKEAKETKETKKTKTPEPVCLEDESAFFIGKLVKGKDALCLPITETAILSENNDAENNTVMISSMLTWQEKGNVIRFILPDAENVKYAQGEYSEPVNYHTSQVSIQAVVQDKEAVNRYESSRIYNWYREYKDKKWSTGTVYLDDYETTADISEPLTFAASIFADIAYQAAYNNNTDKRHIYQITVTGDNQDVLDRRYIGAYSRQGDTTDTLLALQKDIYQNYKDKFIRFRRADIAEGKNISNWSEESVPIKLGGN